MKTAKMNNPTYSIDLNELEFRMREIPKHRFVEYEPSDLEWMVPMGMAPIKEVRVEDFHMVQIQLLEKLERDAYDAIFAGLSFPPMQKP